MYQLTDKNIKKPVANNVYKPLLGQSLFGKSCRIFQLGFVLGMVREIPRNGSYTNTLGLIKKQIKHETN